MKWNVRLLCRTALLLALCIASQFFKNTSVFLTGSVVNTILIIATLSCGLLSGAAISVIAPLTSWWITGSPIMSAYPTIVPSVMVGNLILVAFVWLFAKWLKKRMPESKKMSFSDGRFRQVLLLVLIACILWAALTIAFISSLASVLQIGKTSPLLIVSLVMIAGVFLVFVSLWALVARMPQSWTLVAGMVIGSVVKALFLWLVIVKIILPAGAPEQVKMTFSVTQLLTSLIGSAIAFLVWIPLKKVFSEK